MGKRRILTRLKIGSDGGVLALFLFKMLRLLPIDVFFFSMETGGLFWL